MKDFLLGFCLCLSLCLVVYNISEYHKKKPIPQIPDRAAKIENEDTVIFQLIPPSRMFKEGI